MKPRIEDRGWTTKSELEWLDKIGKANPNTQGMEKETLLRGYLEGARKRTAWGEVDKIAAVAHAHKLLEGI